MKTKYLFLIFGIAILLIIFSFFIQTTFTLTVYGWDKITEAGHSVQTSLPSNLIYFLGGWKSETSSRMEDLRTWGEICKDEEVVCKTKLSLGELEK